MRAEKQPDAPTLAQRAPERQKKHPPLSKTQNTRKSLFIYIQGFMTADIYRTWVNSQKSQIIFSPTNGIKTPEFIPTR